jgi:hypothetical protein
VSGGLAGAFSGGNRGQQLGWAVKAKGLRGSEVGLNLLINIQIFGLNEQ